MKKVDTSYWKKLALELLEKTYKENYRKLTVAWVSRTHFEKELGKVSYIQICENEINSKKDFDRWQERIHISPQEIIKYYDVEKGKFRKFEDVLNDIKKCKLFSITICVKVLKKIANREYLVKLLDKYFIVKSKYDFPIERNSKYKYEWLYVCDDKNNRESILTNEIFEISKDEALSLLL